MECAELTLNIVYVPHILPTGPKNFVTGAALNFGNLLGNLNKDIETKAKVLRVQLTFIISSGMLVVGFTSTSSGPPNLENLGGKNGASVSKMSFLMSTFSITSLKYLASYWVTRLVIPMTLFGNLSSHCSHFSQESFQQCLHKS